MSHLRFAHIFAFLMLLSAVGAFFLPSGAGRLARGNVDGLFAPVAVPVRRVAAWVQQRLGGPDAGAMAAVPEGGASREQMRDEIERLRLTMLGLTQQVDQLRQHSAEMEALGPLKNYCTYFRAIGSDSGSRESLVLQGSGLNGVHAKMPVLYHEGYIAGRVTVAGLSGAQARLITDKGFRVRCSFRRLERNPQTKVNALVPIAAAARVLEGRGDGVMVITDFPIKDLDEAKLGPGNWVVLADADDWPPNLQGYPLGYIDKIERQRRQPLFADVFVRPRENLSQLRNVMVMTRQ